MNLPDPPILVITDRRQCAEPIEARAAALFDGGCRWLSLREKDLEPEIRADLLLRIADIARRFGATVGVHDDLAAAVAHGTALHLPDGADGTYALQVAGIGTLIGKSCHGAADIAKAEAERLDYATLSPVFASASKPGYAVTLTTDGIREIAQAHAIPILALAGIGLDSIGRLAGSGIRGIAVMGEAMTSPDPKDWFKCVAKAWDRIV